MTVYFHDKEYQLADGTTLGQFMAGENLPTTGVATAVNGAVVPASARDSHTLQDGDKILIIKAFYGG